MSYDYFLQDYLHFAYASRRLYRNNIAFYRFPIDNNGRYSFHFPAGVVYGNMVCRAAEFACDAVGLPLRGDTGIDFQTVVRRPDAQDILGDGIKVPGGRAGEPGVLASPGLKASFPAIIWAYT